MSKTEHGGIGERSKMVFSNVLKNEEKAMLALRTLYQRYGYAQFKMSKFEEYDLYLRNKNFLVSDNIITFNDTNGRLLALKPDVTLSIVKNTRDDGTLRKLCYNENVYRVSHTSHEFKEIMQVGLECIGNIDVYSMSEVIMLAEESLKTISEDYFLDISHMGFLTGLLDGVGIDEQSKSAVLKCVSEKNVMELEHLCRASGLSKHDTEQLTAVASLYAPFAQGIEMLCDISMNEKTDSAVDELRQIYRTMSAMGAGSRVNLDFSIVNDMNYYNGVIFQGFIDGVPSGVLSGGRYDNLMHKLGRDAGAIGFAVYLDLLERLNMNKPEYDVDVMLIYDGLTLPEQLAEEVKRLTMSGESVIALRQGGEQVKCRRLMKMCDGKALEVRKND